MPECTTEQVGAACADAGAECDPHDDCNARYRCTDDDPTQQPGGCPISRKRHKRSIHYLSDSERDSAREQVAAMQLATWRYRWESDETRPHLGFLIDDVPESAAVHTDGEHVDLYGYTSLAVAAIQSQDAEIAALREEMAALRAEVTALRAASAP